MGCLVPAVPSRLTRSRAGPLGTLVLLVFLLPAGVRAVPPASVASVSSAATQGLPYAVSSRWTLTRRAGGTERSTLHSLRVAHSRPGAAGGGRAGPRGRTVDGTWLG